MQLSINGLELEIIVGCYDYERTQKQKIIIDLVCDFDYNSVEDKLDNTLNYDYLAKFIYSSLVTTTFNLLESIVFYLEDLLFNTFKQIKKLKLTLSKPDVAIKLGCNKLSISHEAERRVKVAIALGSNTDKLPKQQLITALEIMGKVVDDAKVGNIYLSKPVGFTEQNDFYNTVFIGYTTLSIEKLFAKIKTVEKLMGKREICIDGPRIIDIDLLLYGNVIYNKNYMQVPHPRMHQRDFVLKPLADVASDWVHPEFGVDIDTLLNNLDPNSLSLIQAV